MPKTETILGIHLDAPRVVARAIQTSRRQTERYFASQEFTPHLTLYLARYRTSAFRQLITDLTQQPPLATTLSTAGVLRDETVNGQLFLGLRLAKSSGLIRLHRDVLRRANARRGSLIRTKDKERIQSGILTAAERQRIVTYGYARVLRAFNPHFTIGTLPPGRERAKKLASVRQALASLRTFRWQPTELVVGLYTYDLGRGRYVGRPIEHRIRLRDASSG